MLPKEVCEYIKSALHVVSDDNISNIIELGEGHSGASVYRMKIISRRKRDSGIYVIKLISTSSPWYTTSENEAENSLAIYHNADLFRDRLVDIYADGTVGGYHILIFRQANDSVLNTASLDNLKVSEQVQYINIIAFELLQKMNHGAIISGDANDFFQNLLSYRLDEVGSFEKKIKGLIESTMAPAIAIKKNVYPNPLYYLRNQEEWLPKLQSMSFFKGNVHGDLHRRNVLCSKNLSDISNLQYSVIDYDSYMDNAYLLFDHAYLELSIYLDSIPNNDLNQWYETLSPLLTDSMFSDTSGELGQKEVCLRNAICAGISDWVDKEYRHMRDDIEIQFYMARIAAGINFFSKSINTDNELLVKILLYIGLCLRNLFDKISFEWNADDISRLVYTLSKEDNSDVLWENFVKYSTNYVTVLITDDVYSNDDYNRLEELSRICWSMILDVGSNISPNDISTIVPKKIVNKRNLILRNLISNTEDICYTPNSCAWVVIKKIDKEILSYGVLWTRYQKKSRTYSNK